jgi:hypothetical protein
MMHVDRGDDIWAGLVLCGAGLGVGLVLIGLILGVW